MQTFSSCALAIFGTDYPGGQRPIGVLCDGGYGGKGVMGQGRFVVGAVMSFKRPSPSHFTWRCVPGLNEIPGHEPRDLARLKKCSQPRNYEGPGPNWICPCATLSLSRVSWQCSQNHREYRPFPV